MSSYSEQDDLDRLKAWWKTYGNSLILGIALGAASLVGLRYWNQYSERRLEAASTLYEQMLQDQYARKNDTARKAGETLLSDYRSTPYAALAGLMLAKLSHDSGDATAARTHLQWTIDHAKSDTVVLAARLRLARLYAVSGENERALSILEVKDQAGFESEYMELKGDILSALDRKAEARQNYREALQKLSGKSPYASVLTMKLEDLGPESAP